MVILDTHIWVWWNHQDPKLAPIHKQVIDCNRNDGLGICTITLIEIARLAQQGSITLPLPLHQWFSIALAVEGVMLVTITPSIAIDAVNLPGDFHKDPALRLIVATARSLDCPLITADRQILNYPYVKQVPPEGSGVG